MWKRRLDTEYFAGLDISMDETHVCVLDREGVIVRESKTASTAGAIAVELAKAPSCRRIVFETGRMAPILFHGLSQLGLPVVCVESRQAYQALKSLATHKTDRNDARGLAHLARTGFFKPVHVKSLSAHALRSLIIARKKLVGQRVTLENQIRGLAVVFGIRLPRALTAAFVDQAASSSRHSGTTANSVGESRFCCSSNRTQPCSWRVGANSDVNSEPSLRSTRSGRLRLTMSGAIWAAEDGAAGRQAATPASRLRLSALQWAAIAVAFLAVLIAAGWFGPRVFAPSPPPPPPVASVQERLTSESRLSIVVLPFANLSGDPEQDYFADGLTDDLTTDLSHLSDSFVIAHTTALTYKGKAVDA